jgi:type IV fimbrial biogenesis protein FimT
MRAGTSLATYSPRRKRRFRVQFFELGRVTAMAGGHLMVARRTAPGSSAFPQDGGRGERGFTLVEVIITMIVLSLILGAGMASLHRYIRQQQVDRAADAILWEITVARSYAIRKGESVRLVIDEASRSLTVRDDAQTWRTLRLGPGTELPVDSLTIDIPGDSLIFSFRGFCLNCSNVSAATMAVKVGNKQRQVQVGFLGRAERIRQ